MPYREKTPARLGFPDDRGRAKYFRGRTREIEAFRDLCLKSRKNRDGSIFLIQGAPGAGKTALLHRCADLMGNGKDRWRTAFIAWSALHNPRTLARDLDISYATKTTKRNEAIGEGEESASVEISGQFPWGHERELSGLAVSEIIRKAARRRGLILVLDEIQGLRRLADSSSAVAAATAECLDQIHNGRIGAPVVLLAGGLGTSERVLSALEISRFRANCLHQLAPLEPEEARSVIRDWLVKDGGAASTDAQLAHWIDVLAAECHGWPQHLQIYAQPAAAWVQNNKGVLTGDIPEQVLALARRFRSEYYHQRASVLNWQDRSVLADFLAQKDPSDPMLENDLIAAFSRDRSSEEARKVFDGLVRKGVVAETPDGRYRIPVPSMRRWLVDKFAGQTK